MLKVGIVTYHSMYEYTKNIVIDLTVLTFIIDSETPFYIYRDSTFSYSSMGQYITDL